MWEDTIVKEIRAIREQHAAKFNYDLPAILKDIKKQEQDSQVVFVTRPPRKPAPFPVAKENLSQVSKE